MSAPQFVSDLAIGSVVEGKALLAGVTDDKIQFKVRERAPSGVVTFDIAFMGIKLGAVAGKPSDTKVIWTETK